MATPAPQDLEKRYLAAKKALEGSRERLDSVLKHLVQCYGAGEFNAKVEKEFVSVRKPYGVVPEQRERAVAPERDLKWHLNYAFHQHKPYLDRYLEALRNYLTNDPDGRERIADELVAAGEWAVGFGGDKARQPYLNAAREPAIEKCKNAHAEWLRSGRSAAALPAVLIAIQEARIAGADQHPQVISIEADVQRALSR